MKLLITGGHHSSAIPVIHALKLRDPDVDICWVGHKYSLKDDKNVTLEYKEINVLEIPFYELKTGKFYNNWNLRSLLKIIKGFVLAGKLLSELKPDLVLSFGGYLAAPVVFAAWLKHIPSLTHEQTLVAGYANRFIAIFADKVLISWQESKKFFNPKKTVYTGLPLRASIFTRSTNNFGSDNKLPYIYIAGGKTGSHIINTNVEGCLAKLLEIANVIHQCGDYSVTTDYEVLARKYEGMQNIVTGKYFLRKFVLEDEIGEVFSRADLVVSRAGAHITSELVALKKPSLLIPIPWVSHNEQNINAQYLVNIGLAGCLDEKSLSPEVLVANIKDMLSTLGEYVLKNTDHTYTPDSAKLIVDEIYKTLNKK